MIGISAGNHAQALAWGAAQEEIDALVVMWRDASEAKVAATRGYGAAVDLEAADVQSRRSPGSRSSIARDRPGARAPVRRPARIAGAGDGRARDPRRLAGVETILVPAGGGGLVAGIAAAARRRRVSSVEPDGSTRRARRASRPGSRCRSHPARWRTGSPRRSPGEIALEMLRPHGVGACSSRRTRSRTAFRLLYARAKLAVEPAAAIGLAALLAGRSSGGRVAVVVSGGNVAPETASAILGGR